MSMYMLCVDYNKSGQSVKLVCYCAWTHVLLLRHNAQFSFCNVHPGVVIFSIFYEGVTSLANSRGRYFRRGPHAHVVVFNKQGKWFVVLNKQGKSNIFPPFHTLSHFYLNIPYSDTKPPTPPPARERLGPVITFSSQEREVTCSNP